MQQLEKNNYSYIYHFCSNEEEFKKILVKFPDVQMELDELRKIERERIDVYDTDKSELAALGIKLFEKSKDFQNQLLKTFKVAKQRAETHKAKVEDILMI